MLLAVLYFYQLQSGMTALQLCFSAHVAQDKDLYQLLGYVSPDFYPSSLGYRYVVPDRCVPITLLKLDADPNIKDNVCLK